MRNWDGKSYTIWQKPYRYITRPSPTGLKEEQMSEEEKPGNKDAQTTEPPAAPVISDVEDVVSNVHELPVRRKRDIAPKTTAAEPKPPLKPGLKLPMKQLLDVLDARVNVWQTAHREELAMIYHENKIGRRISFACGILVGIGIMLIVTYL